MTEEPSREQQLRTRVITTPIETMVSMSMILMAIAMVSMSNRALAMVRMLLNPIETMVSNEHDANGN